MLGKAFLNSRNVTQRRQRTIPSLFNVPPDKQRIVGDQPIDTNINQVLDQVEPVGRPRLDLHAVSMSGIDHGLVSERDESGKGGVGDGRGVGCRYGREEIGADGCGRLDWSDRQRSHISGTEHLPTRSATVEPLNESMSIPASQLDAPFP
jgi:hypothetical protein